MHFDARETPSLRDASAGNSNAEPIQEASGNSQTRISRPSWDFELPLRRAACRNHGRVHKGAPRELRQVRVAPDHVLEKPPEPAANAAGPDKPMSASATEKETYTRQSVPVLATNELVPLMNKAPRKTKATHGFLARAKRRASKEQGDGWTTPAESQPEQKPPSDFLSNSRLRASKDDVEWRATCKASESAHEVVSVVPPSSCPDLLGPADSVLEIESDRPCSPSQSTEGERSGYQPTHPTNSEDEVSSKVTNKALTANAPSADEREPARSRDSTLGDHFVLASDAVGRIRSFLARKAAPDVSRHPMRWLLVQQVPTNLPRRPFLWTSLLEEMDVMGAVDDPKALLHKLEVDHDWVKDVVGPKSYEIMINEVSLLDQRGKSEATGDPSSVGVKENQGIASPVQGDEEREMNELTVEAPSAETRNHVRLAESDIEIPNLERKPGAPPSP
ncbi:hypothetical protein BD626DRAFT_571035 [Schizophyllum amplum]|uniref:Uncharacterized protein n=1 Tax=Schizophyllum amplum TaxID=97359 RepID=A0A550C9B3_9AGAR|nr:hypothetical protein BD626DRAFT_571035 [Auriculariopsis ampla]